MVADVTRDVVPQLFSEKMYFYNYSCVHEGIIEHYTYYTYYIHYTYFFSLLFCLNYAVFDKDGTPLIARK